MAASATLYTVRLTCRPAVSRFVTPVQAVIKQSVITFTSRKWSSSVGNLAAGCSSSSIFRKPGCLSTRSFTSSSEQERHWADVSLDEFEDLVVENDTVIIDVRQPWELESFGSFSEGFNIPLGEVHSALQMNDADFQAKYGHNKPGKEDNIVFYCMVGIRSRRSLNSALTLGYSKARHYIGGWKEWSEKILKKPI